MTLTLSNSATGRQSTDSLPVGKALHGVPRGSYGIHATSQLGREKRTFFPRLGLSRGKPEIVATGVIGNRFS